MNTHHGDVTSLAISYLEIFANLVKGNFPTRSTRSIQSSHLLRFRIVVETEHITTNACRARLGDIDGCCDSNCCILRNQPLDSIFKVVTSYRSITTFP